ncbi:Histone-lysine N-methyltransferase SETMAR [Eumeta japonica]|uniref:Histone-lysine N-methyltransferase SETMAR n=1 Tax=Eumeta variegata TaxID=151549 RepID=A0A4C1UUF2_EUMVA|nr:Histone-lysine N-methyltransferase SETMAR [Eumeta japonica]
MVAGAWQLVVEWLRNPPSNDKVVDCGEACLTQRLRRNSCSLMDYKAKDNFGLRPAPNSDDHSITESTRALYSNGVSTDEIEARSKEKLPGLINRSGVVFHYHKARPITFLTTEEILKESGWEVLMHPPHSPDLAPSNFHQFGLFTIL